MSQPAPGNPVAAAGPPSPTGVPATQAPRQDVTFLSHGVRCAAWLYRPEGATTPTPLVIMAHGLGGNRQMRLEAYAQRFVAAGMAALVFDYRSFGDSEGEPRQVVDVKAQLEDWRAALAYARTELEDIDRSRIAIWGTSFGGGHVLQIAGEDHAVAAVVAQCPFTDGIASVMRRFLAFPPSAFVLTVAAVLDVVGRVLGRPPLLVPMAGTKWMPAFLVSDDSLSGAAAQAKPGSVVSARTSRVIRRFPSLKKHLGANLELSDREVPKADDSLWGVVIGPTGAITINAIAARLVLTLAWYRPARTVRRSGNTPILICACDGDAVAPVGPTIRAGKGRSNVTVNRYPYGHFDIYLGDAFERAVADQTAFLQQALA